MSAGINVVKRTSTIFRKIASVADVVEVYKQVSTRQMKKLTEELNINLEKARKSALAKNLEIAKGYYRVEIAPPTSAEEMKRLQTDIRTLTEFMRSGCYKYLTVKQAWLLFLVITEVLLWFYLGETIGKMHIVGYKV